MRARTHAHSIIRSVTSEDENGEDKTPREKINERVVWRKKKRVENNDKPGKGVKKRIYLRIYIYIYMLYANIVGITS